MLGFLLAVALSVQAQAARSPVAVALSPSSTIAAIPELIKTLDPKGRIQAIADLDRLDRGVLGPATLADLSEAYRLLGQAERALKAATTLSSLDPKSSAGTAQSILVMTQSGNYAAAQATAESGLKRFPGDKDLLALLHQVKGRGVAIAPIVTEAGKSSAKTQPRSDSGDKPFVLAVKSGSSRPPPSPPVAGESDAYLSPGARKRSQVGLFLDNVLSVGLYNIDRETPKERLRMADLRNSVDSTESGRALVADMGGWKQIERDVDMRFVWMRSAVSGAYARPLLKADSQGHRYVLALNSEMMNEPDAIAAPILAHELSHIRDFRAGATKTGLHIPSEFAAHRTQIYVFEELKSRMTQAQIADLKSRYSGQYQLFIAMIWEDHLLRRFQNSGEMAKETGDIEGYRDMSAQILADLKSKKVAPGSPQLDYHLNSEADGLYRFMTNERDIVDLIKERNASPDYTTQQRARDAAVLNEREKLLALAEKRDRDFRTKQGFTIAETK